MLLLLTSLQSKQQRVVLGDLDTASKNGLCLESGGSLQKRKDLELENKSLTTGREEGRKERMKERRKVHPTVF